MKKVSEDASQYNLSPPIPPGEKILSADSFCALVPEFDPKNPQSITSWQCFSSEVGEKNFNLGASTTIADKTEIWASSLQRVSDPTNGNEVACVLGKDSAYVISSKDTNSPPTFTKKKRTDSSQGTATFFSKFVLDTSEQENSQVIHTDRLLYCMFSDGTNTITVHDVDDPSFHFIIELPFKIVDLCAVLQIASGKKNYWVWVLQSQDRPCFCFIEHSRMINAGKTGSSLKGSDLILHAYADEYANFYVRDVLIGSYYFDSDNPGSQQIIVLSNSSLVALVHMLSLDSQGKVQEVTPVFNQTFKITFFGLPTPMQLENYFSKGTNFRPGSLQHLIAPNGNHSFYVNAYGQVYNSVTYCAATTHMLVSFNRKSKTFSSPGYYTYAVQCKPIWPSKNPSPSVEPVVGIVNQLAVAEATVNISAQDSKGVYSGFRLFYSLAAMTAIYDPTPDLSVYITCAFCNYPEFQNIAFGSSFIKLAVNSAGDYYLPQGSNPFPISDKGRWIDNYTHLGMLQLDDSFFKSNNIFNTHSAGVPGAVFDYTKRYSQGCFMSCGVDFMGKSLVLGNPHLSLYDKSIQPLGFYRSMPFQSEAQKIMPLLTIANSNTVVKGISKSTHSTWHAGYNANVQYHGVIATASAHFGQSWGGSKMHMSSDQKTISLHVTSGVAESDLVHTYNSLFYLWDYPIYQKITSDAPLGEITVLIPHGFSEAILDATDPRLGHVQDYEIGQILTYLDSEKPGYLEKNLWFTRETITCTSDAQSGGSSVIYSKQNSTHLEDGKSTMDGMNAGGSIGFHYGPVSATVSAFYSKNNVENSATSTLKSEDFTVSFHSGVIEEEGYEYAVTPLIYGHKDNNMLMINCEVQLIGPLWKNHFQTPEIIMMRTYPAAKVLRLKHFTRSIRFSENADQTVDISLHLFSNSYSPSANIVCNVYAGMAFYISENKPPVTTKLKLLGTVKVASLDGLQRYIAVLKNQHLQKNTHITVEVFHDDAEQINAKYYWGVYPFSASIAMLKETEEALP